MFIKDFKLIIYYFQEFVSIIGKYFNFQISLNSLQLIKIFKLLFLCFQINLNKILQLFHLNPLIKISILKQLNFY